MLTILGLILGVAGFFMSKKKEKPLTLPIIAIAVNLIAFPVIKMSYKKAFDAEIKKAAAELGISEEAARKMVEEAQ